jgi:hypothetical protein
MKNILLLSVLSLLLASCTRPGNDDERFEKYKDYFIEDYWKLYPGEASYMGYHKYDSILTVPDEAFRRKERLFAQAHKDSLDKFPLNRLHVANRTDYMMIRNQIDRIVFEINELKSYEWNPAQYNVSGSFAEILNGTYAPLEERLRDIGKRLSYVPEYYSAAKANIKSPALEHTDLAIRQNRGGLPVFTTDMQSALQKSTLDENEQKTIKVAVANAISAINDYVSWLEKLENPNPRSFRLGDPLYAKKFELEIVSSFSADEIYQRALTHKRDLHRKMFVLADRLWPKYLASQDKPADSLQLIKTVIDKISLNHTNPEHFQSEIEKQIPELSAFVQEKDLLYIDPSKPLVVRREPDYMAGVAGASISAPGPYDKNANTYYNVGSMSGWPAEQSESYLREYNDYILQILNIHEAIPGHYTQLVYQNQSPGIIKSVFGNGAMIEGWAVYAELMMLENGYKNSDEMWLMYYKWNLRSTCNTILDISVHTKNMSKEEAKRMLVNEAFQQEAEAEGKWTRVTLSQVQLCSYFTGFTEIYDLREKIRQLKGNQFDLKDFHHKFLGYGSAPVKYIKELMLSEK